MILTSERPLKAVGFETLTGLSAMKHLTPPQSATVAQLTATGEAVRWRDDGSDPTATVGQTIPADKTFRYVGNLRTIRFIEAAASATLTVTYYAPDQTISS